MQPLPNQENWNVDRICLCLSARCRHAWGTDYPLNKCLLCLSLVLPPLLMGWHLETIPLRTSDLFSHSIIDLLNICSYFTDEESLFRNKCQQVIYSRSPSQLVNCREEIEARWLGLQSHVLSSIREPCDRGSIIIISGSHMYFWTWFWFIWTKFSVVGPRNLF